MRIYSTERRFPAILYCEVPYEEYREDGSFKRSGLKDFSAKSYGELVRYVVRAYTGEISPRGRKLTKVIGSFMLEKGESPCRAAALLYGDQAVRIVRA